MTMCTSAGLRSCSASASAAWRLTTFHSFTSSVGHPTPVSTRIAPAFGCLITKPCTGMLLSTSIRARCSLTISSKVLRQERRDREQDEQHRHVRDRVGEDPSRPPPPLYPTN